MAGDPKQTPAMRQYFAFKARFPDALLFFRMGDFYELFGEDAKTASRVLGLTLTKRQSDLAMAGAPYHQLETYLRRALAAGYRVAVADQVQDPKDAKGVVARAVTRVVTQGTLADDALLPDDATSAIVAVCPLGARGFVDGHALACVELATGAVRVGSLSGAGPVSLADELARRGASELLYPEAGDGATPGWVSELVERLGVSATPRPSWQFRPAEAMEAIREQYGVSTLAGFGMPDDDACVAPLGAALRYLRETQTVSLDHAANPDAVGDATVELPRVTLSHLEAPRREASDGSCVIDAVSLRSLEVERTIRAGDRAGGETDREGSLLSLFLAPGLCRTPMGKRLLREWLVRPLGTLASIHARQSAVATLVEDRRTAQELSEALSGVQDVPRLAARLALGRAGPRDLVALGSSLSRAGPLLSIVQDAPALRGHAERLEAAREAVAPLAARITETCAEDAPAHLRDGGFVRDGIDAALDEARALERDAGQWLAEYQAKLHAEHDLPSLKVGYNKVFGYYIELPAAQARRAPAAFTRKQTLKNAERYITPELKTFEDKVSTATERALARERAIFDELCELVRAQLRPATDFGEVAAELDALGALASKAAKRGWVKPEVVASPVLRIRAGRHPVLDEKLAHNFVPNDTELGGGASGEGESEAEGPEAPVALITGPNMAGKSTYIRQTALLVLLAHAGSFVPADRAVVGLTDRIFTRVGADDALHRGQSTFMVEMTETANILNHATGRSLVVLDEIGRGTSTLDGLSLAWAIAEHLADREEPPRTLFATHYHELTELEERLPGRVRNLHVAVRELDRPPAGDGDEAHGEIVFLHRILPGRTDQSYGIHVARLAGVPRAVTERAKEVLDSLAVQHRAQAAAATSVPERRARGRGDQLGLFTEFVHHPAVDRLRELKLDTMSPLQAFDELRKLAASAREGEGTP
ncbi:MAG: DNA mismatch repair protein MutS [Phycisphaerales bacterium]|nr:MAG: DNA mismatch repair protein MutS [Phycisphaerales bacterium]